jgi:hypothetical protein
MIRIVVTGVSGYDYMVCLLPKLIVKVKIVVWLLHQRVAAMIFIHQKISERKPM